ncbi:MFS transporter [Facklamia sp. P12932]|uniref:MFS transporter n=1 Tax=Facklamia sp. P12932 TaxID=3421947 RepID=UPI003D180DA9
MNKKSETQQSKFNWLPLIILMITQIGTTGDNAVLSIATKSIIETFSVTMNEIQLANMMYPMIAGSFMITSGMLGISFGFKNVFRVGAILATIGELTLALTNNITIFIWVGRVLVGFGGSLMIPAVLGLIPEIYKSSKHRAIAFGSIGAASGIATIAPLLLGIIMDQVGYKLTFGIMAAYFFIILLGSYFIPNTDRVQTKLKLDVQGIVMAAVGLFTFLIGLSKISKWGLITPADPPFTIFGISPALPLVVLGIVILIALVFVEKKIEEKNGFALLPQSFIKNRQVRNGLYGSAFIFLIMGAYNVVVIPYVQIMEGFDATKTSLLTMAFGVTLFLFSFFIPKFAQNIKSKTILRLGYLVVALSIVPLLLAIGDGSTNISLFSIGILIMGAGEGLVSSRCNVVVANAVNERDAKQSGGIQATSRNVGQAFGAALIGTILLFSVTMMTNNIVDKKVSELSAETVQVIAEQEQHQYVNDQQYNEFLEANNIMGEDKVKMEEINDVVRVKSTKVALGAIGIISLIFLLGTRGIKE